MHAKNEKQGGEKEKQTTLNLHTDAKKLSKKQKRKQQENEMKAKLLRDKVQKQAIREEKKAKLRRDKVQKQAFREEKKAKAIREEKKFWGEQCRLGKIAAVSPAIAGGDQAATENVRMNHPLSFIPSPASSLSCLPRPDEEFRALTHNILPPSTYSISRPIQPNRHRSRLLRARPR